MRRDDLYFLTLLAFSQAWLIPSYFARDGREAGMGVVGVIWAALATLWLVLG